MSGWPVHLTTFFSWARQRIIKLSGGGGRYRWWSTALCKLGKNRTPFDHFFVLIKIALDTYIVLVRGISLKLIIRAYYIGLRDKER